MKYLFVQFFGKMLAEDIYKYKGEIYIFYCYYDLVPGKNMVHLDIYCKEKSREDIILFLHKRKCRIDLAKKILRRYDEIQLEEKNKSNFYKNSLKKYKYMLEGQKVNK